ncbi:MAG: ABC transporter permease [Spirochaetaceae bacterium]|jgi:phospholipid/cholesterol/gamma-HCH transport system permease protein|nr:ABC transporter permease [Spirochaetaceae bacterium]
MTSLFYAIGFFSRLLKASGQFIVRGKASRKIFTMQILFTFVEALPVSSLLALATGSMLNIVLMPMFTDLSQQALSYPVMVTIIARELGPLLTAIIVSSRSATAIATEIAGIVIQHEAEAYIATGIDPLEHLAAPRLLAVIVSLFFLNIYFSIFGLAASFGVSQFFNPMPASVYFNSILEHLSLADILMILVKSIVLGTIIATTALYYGFRVERASTEVPVAGLKAVSRALSLCIIADVLLSLVYYVTI